MNNEYTVYKVTPEENNSVIKNNILDTCKTRFAFVIQDDIDYDVAILDEYCELLIKYKTCLTFYGYYGQANKVLLVNNPAVDVKISDNEHLIVNRSVSKGFICMDVSSINSYNLHFDINIKTAEMEEFMSRISKVPGLLPFGEGYYIDLQDSNRIKIKNNYEYKFDVVKLNNEILADKKYLESIKYKPEINPNVNTFLLLVKKFVAEYNLKINEK